MLCRQLLEARLVVLATGALGADTDVVEQQTEDNLCRSLPPGINEHCAEDRFEGIGKNRLLVTPTRLVFTAAEQELRPDADAAGNLGQRRRVDHRCPQLGQLALGQVVVHAEDVLGDGQPEYGVAKKLEPFVRLGCVRLGAMTAVGQCELEQCGISELIPEIAGQIVGVGRLVQESAPTWLKT